MYFTTIYKKERQFIDAPLFINSYLNERWRLLENAFAFSSCDVNSVRFIHSPAIKRSPVAKVMEYQQHCKQSLIISELDLL